ncbi:MULTISPECIES: cysteine hydrolase family protein [Chryseobacterium]|uniref:Nicotinamidase-related amidase n=1 Tax=Chryseobacterium camelliae TaxID=1265445 RepID=A0ABU0TJ12_9FLAO|nr:MULTISPECIES: isochorismatase family cysteine hydrolase [Chryseobacterium]MDT3406031.1 nicotinamidase-related amidase [Pseudacidovorax intermedius]MDQ1096168.1 nicotinamidase-related amidase [Chryseobacterium camelliae]MDQ1100104.1 nicotinamidase-related amidase [Chryseobacterium sp. SORGH_AS_1048]MDR6087448.1 nicotinamidase-related amidase [Chryseobacterium sp. SORGH_AS_0909]MDR6131822.1 nicotinamidase-related amidase [Chryseobacterium sp. SORGH_AS_1175]
MKNTALLVMDMQSSILSTLPDTQELVSNIKKAIQAARNHQIPVIYITVNFRKGMPEISANNKAFSAMKTRMADLDMKEWATIHPELTPEEHDIIIAKKRFSAFTGSDLEIVLRGLDIQHLVVTGVSTSGVVLSTIREASDKDYQLTVIRDCCKDGDEEVHSVLINKIFPRQADVISVNEWLR